MDDPRAVICYISSDEESSGEMNGDGGGGGSGDDYDWIRELMGDDDGAPDDSDDVVLVRELILKRKESSKFSDTAARDSVKVVDNDDDDCVVLEEDPDKPVEVGNDKGNDDSDDLLVVSEKGQVACRDYPHPRHLCAKFPFASTAHENHCNQCHCYVCDSLAPCVFWGNGNHCHATDEDEFWKAQRQCTKESDKVQPVVPNIPGVALPVGSSLENRASSSPQQESNHMAQNQVLSQGPNLSRSVPRSLGTPNNAYRNVIPTNQRQNGSQIGTRILPSGTAFKRPGSVTQALKPPGVGYYSSRSYDRSQFVKNLPLGPRCVDHHCMTTPGSNPQSRQSSIGCSLSSPVSSESQLSLQLSLGSTSVNSSGPHIFSHSPVNTTDSVPSKAQTFSPSPHANSMYSQPQVAYQPYVGSTYGKSYQSETQLSSQLHVSGALANSVPSKPPVLSQPYAECNSANIVASHPQAVNHSNRGNNFENQIHHDELTYMPSGDNYYRNPTQLTFQPNGATSFQNSLTSQPHLSWPPNGSNCFPCQDAVSLDPNTATNAAESCTTPIYMSHDGQNVSQPANHINSFERDFSVSGETLFNKSNEPHYVGSADKSLLAADPNAQFAGSSPANALDFQFDNSNFGNPAILGATEVSLPPGVNVYSLESASVDSWNLF